MYISIAENIVKISLVSRGKEKIQCILCNLLLQNMWRVWHQLKWPHPLKSLKVNVADHMHFLFEEARFSSSRSLILWRGSLFKFSRLNIVSFSFQTSTVLLTITVMLKLPCGLVGGYQNFSEIYHLHLQGHIPPKFWWPPMKATLHHKPDHHHWHLHHRQNLKSWTIMLCISRHLTKQ